MKKILFCLLLACSFVAKAQVFNNEWIDYSKTYYKFYVFRNGLFRINQSTLTSAGLGSTPAEQFQLWRNGRQVPLYTSVTSGALPANGYIEFLGQMNDGKADRELYRDPSYQLNDKWSLESDTAAYFLTVNTNSAANLRIASAANNVATTTLTPDPYFMHTWGNYFRSRVIRDTLIGGNLVNDTLLNYPQLAPARPNKDIYLGRINPGYAINVGEYLYSSSYDRGEGWSSAEVIALAKIQGLDTIVVNGQMSQTVKNLYAYNGGPDVKFLVSASGNAVNTRRYKIEFNGDSIFGRQLDFFTYGTDSVYFPPSKLNSVNTINLTTIANLWCYDPPVGCQQDRLVVHKYEITYPRQFNFGGANYFEFKLPANAAGNFLKITNFAYGSAQPVLYDVTNGKRYVGDISTPSMVQFVLDPSATERQLVLMSDSPVDQNTVASLQSKHFIDFGNNANQGNYLIITNPVLSNGSGGNPIDDYKNYRSSAAGGGYNAHIYMVDELVDQFGFGIKRNPAGLRNFVRFARLRFSSPIKHLFIIGHGVNYVHQRGSEQTPDIDQLNLVPTFGWPASDQLLTAEPGTSKPLIPVGRLSAINAQEVAAYLKKVKDFELQQSSSSGSAAEKSWMKNIVHIVGASEPDLELTLSNDLDAYATIIKDTLFGANVEKFGKSSSSSVEQLNNTRLQHLFDTGISIITYFGHSSSTTLEFNLDNPENYNNFGKYPLFIGLGCNAGNFFNYSPVRLQAKETISEKYVLAPDRGTIGMVASTHFGIVHYLNTWATNAYQNLSYKHYGATMGEIMQFTAEDVLNDNTEEDFYARTNVEESEFHGDPAIRINPLAKPDYVIEDQMVRVSPSFISVADNTFRFDAHFLNIGRAPSDSITVEVTRQIGTAPATVVQRTRFPGVRYTDSLVINIPINPNSDKGINKITVRLDADNEADELYENNNIITKEVMIYEDEARPAFPYNFSIVSQPNVKFVASTANPFSPSKSYMMEIDTTELFNSPLKVTSTVTAKGGPMEFTPGINFTDSTVYYWRVAPVVTTGQPVWNTSSFIYINNSDPGFAQAHAYQHFKSVGNGLKLDSTSRIWKFGQRYMNLFVREGSWVSSTGQEAGLSISANGNPFIRNTCWFQSVVVNVFDGTTFVPWENHVPTGTAADAYKGGQYGSATNTCSVSRTWNFEYRWDSLSSRKKAMNFINDTIPNGSYVVVRSFLLDPVGFSAYANMIKYAQDWKAEDEAAFGAGKSLYWALKNAGFTAIDSFNRPRQFAFVYKKGDPSFTPKWVFTDGVSDNVTLSVDCPYSDEIGVLLSPEIGPAKQWKQLKWNGRTADATPGDNPRVDVIGITSNGQVADTLIRDLGLSQQTYDLSSIDAHQYPYLQLRMRNKDTANFTPYQLRYWNVSYTPVPEGAVAPAVFFSMKDTLEIAEPLDFKLAFKNVSTTPFDSLRVKIVVTDKDNLQHVLHTFKYRPLAVSNPDTLHISYPIDTRQYVGTNMLYVEVNPDEDQPEQYHFNNFIYRNFYVRGDTTNPLLDVTFDNIHILNNDIVSAKPNILIKLKDEAKYFLQQDPSKIRVQLTKTPDENDPVGWTRQYNFGTDTLEFVPATQANGNTASAIFKPIFDDGEYRMVIGAKDMSDNQAGKVVYRVNFNVFNKPMISNMMNYPNPFTTSTAFVFTLTGSEIPQNIRIQVLTITGKVVREITKDELGPLRIGRNITDFKWDGTDQYGQKLANGVYLYRVITNLNGKSLDKYTAQDDNTDKYFNKGYGKMYLMR